MPSPTRMTIALNEQIQERLKNLGEKFDISYARLISCLLLLSDDEVKAAIDKNHDTLFVSKAQQKEKEKEMLKMLKGMTPEQLANMLANQNQGGN